MFQWLTNKFKKSERAITYAAGASAGLIPAPSYSGMPVTELTALSLSPLWAGIKVISEAVGSLPPTLYRTTKDGSKVAESHPLYHLLHAEPNAEQTRPVFWETFMHACLLWGNGYAEVERDNGGRPVALWNLHPAHVRVARDSATGKLLYKVQYSTAGGPPGQPGSEVTLPAENVIHVPGLSPDGSVGYQLLKLARETVGFGLAAQRYGCCLFRNLGRPGGVITAPPHIEHTNEIRENLKRSFRQETGGENVGTVLLMEQGYSFEPLEFSTNQQTQYVELLAFMVEEVARLLNISPTKLQSLGRATWGNLTELNRDFYTTTLRPWLEKIEAESEKKLLLPSEKGKYEVEFDCSELLRTDQMSRYQSYAVGLKAGFLEINEVRAWENLPPLPEPEPVQPQLPAVQGDDKQGDATEDQAPQEGETDDA